MTLPRRWLISRNDNLKIPHDNSSNIQAIIKIEELITDFVGSTSGALTPHLVMNCLKNEYKESGYTHLGFLLDAYVRSKKELDIIRWVVFHFDLPSVIPAWDEKATRNWISLRSQEQPLLDKVHEETIEKGSEYISHIYAPSVVSAKMKTISENCRHLNQKWWIYHLDCIHEAEGEARHRQCHDHKEYETDILCFNCDPSYIVRILSCNNNISESVSSYCNLGSLLNGEDEEETANRYLEYAKLIKDRRSTEFMDLRNHTSISCNYYARVPMFFYSSPSRYMTEIFVAFQDNTNNINIIVRILKQIVPILRTCVSLVNSHVAYAFAHEANIQGEIQSRLQEQAHTIVNNYTANELKRALSIDDPSETKRIVHDALIGVETLEIATRIALNRGFPDDFPRSILAMLEWLASRCHSKKAIGVLTIKPFCKEKDITYIDDLKRASAFTALWNLWDNSEKVTSFYGRTKFEVEASATDDKLINIRFNNFGSLSKDWRNYLLGSKSKSPNHKLHTSGLEIVKRKMDILDWKFSKIIVSKTGYTAITIEIPLLKADSIKGGNHGFTT